MLAQEGHVSEGLKLCVRQTWNTLLYRCMLLCRDSELAKFEAFLSKLGGSNTRAMVRGRQRLAYPISKCASMLLPHAAAIAVHRCDKAELHVMLIHQLPAENSLC